MFYLYIAVGLLFLVPLIGAVALGALSRRRPATLGVREGRLAPCPAAPNSVSSQAADPTHHVEPLPLEGTAAQAQSRLRRVLSGMPRTSIVRAEKNYLHAECKSRLVGFVDDIEFLIDEPSGVVHVRSASRVGYSDLGVNRRRVEQIRIAWSSARQSADDGSPLPEI